MQIRRNKRRENYLGWWECCSGIGTPSKAVLTVCDNDVSRVTSGSDGERRGEERGMEGVREVYLRGQDYELIFERASR